MNRREMEARYGAATRPRGNRTRRLVLGLHGVQIDGLDDELAALLDRRWGAFLAGAPAAPARATVVLTHAGSGSWLSGTHIGKPYRLETFGEGRDKMIVSDHFALGGGAGPGSWRAAIGDDPAEPLERILDNVGRILAAQLALDDGGFALHAAGVLKDRQAYLLAGPSRSGKSTAVRLAAPAASLGDDLAVVLPADEGWRAPALPFDNAERIDHRPPAGLFPIAGIWRLFQSRASRVERVPPPFAVASLMSCAAFPWLFPERSAQLLDGVRGFVDSGRFAHLHFRDDAGLWEQLAPGG